MAGRRTAEESEKALRTPDMAERLRTWANEVVASTPDEFASFFRAQVEKFTKVVKDANIPLQD